MGHSRTRVELGSSIVFWSAAPSTTDETCCIAEGARNVPRDEIANAIARCAGRLADSVATGESIDLEDGRAIHYGGNKSSSTVEHELRCFRHSQIASLYFV